MYTLTFSRDTVVDVRDHRYTGRQMYGAVVIPYSGIFTTRESGNNVVIPKIVCPYQVNDIFALQERWARAGNSYVYRTDYPEDDTEIDLVFNFRPATTMPVSAARMFGRIVSIQPWSITEDIINKYLTAGGNIDSYAGAAKVIGYYDSGNRILSNLRNSHNRKVLNKSYQPFVSTTPNLVTRNRYYTLREEIQYRASWTYTQDPHAIAMGFNHGGWSAQSTKSNKGMAYYKAEIPYEETQPDGSVVEKKHGLLRTEQTLDTSYGTLDAWEYTTTVYGPKSFEELQSIAEKQHLAYRGEAWGSTESNPSFIYIRLDKQGNAIPKFATYPTTMIDPSLHLHAWLISAYLCDKEGNMIGNMF